MSWSTFTEPTKQDVDGVVLSMINSDHDDLEGYFYEMVRNNMDLPDSVVFVHDQMSNPIVMSNINWLYGSEQEKLMEMMMSVMRIAVEDGVEGLTFPTDDNFSFIYFANLDDGHKIYAVFSPAGMNILMTDENGEGGFVRPQSDWHSLLSDERFPENIQALIEYMNERFNG